MGYNICATILEYQPVTIERSSSVIDAIDHSKRIKVTVGATVNAADGVTLLITCPVLATPNATIKWLFQAREIPPDSDMFAYDMSTGGVIIPKMTEKYAGVYTCRATQKSRIVNAYTKVNYFGKFTAQKINFSIKDFFSKWEQISMKPRIWSHLLKKSLMENFIFCAVVLSETVTQMRSVKRLF